MPVNRNALIRYKTLDACFRNRYRKWTLEDLIEKVSEALYEYEGKQNDISKRTIQADIQMMRSDKLGYNAPIMVVDKKYYTYEDKKYSITQTPITEQDLQRMNEAVEVLRQFKGFSHFSNLGTVVQKLEDHVRAAAPGQKSVIDFEKNDGLKGLGHLETIYKSIIEQRCLDLSYRSFKARDASRFFFHVWWLKEFKNRWFAVGVKNNQEDILSLALDRIVSIEENEHLPPYRPNLDLDPEAYYKDVIGVTVSKVSRPQEVLIKIVAEQAPYVITKPFHPSQKVLSVDEVTGEVMVSFKVQLNYELEREILGFGDYFEVLAPEKLRRTIAWRLGKAKGRYLEETTKNDLG